MVRRLEEVEGVQALEISLSPAAEANAAAVLAAAQRLTKEFHGRLEFIEQQEDIWYECIDRKKWTTYETVCLKNYLPGRAAEKKPAAKRKKPGKVK